MTDELRSTPPSREATTWPSSFLGLLVLRSTPPSREATSCSSILPSVTMLRSTPPSREATLFRLVDSETIKLRSTPPSREATRTAWPLPPRYAVAIHAPLAGGDRAVLGAHRGSFSCDPRPPRGRRPRPRVTDSGHTGCDPRPPRGRRLRLWRLALCGRRVAIHAPLAGGDADALAHTPSVRVAIHAPLAGGDHIPAPYKGEGRRCDPRPPRGRRLTRAKPLLASVVVAIHAPLAGGDWGPPYQLGVCMLRSTPPSREATRAGRPSTSAWCCDPRPPRGRRLEG